MDCLDESDEEQCGKLYLKFSVFGSGINAKLGYNIQKMSVTMIKYKNNNDKY